MLTKPSATLVAEIVRRGMASGHLLAKQIIVRRNLAPPLPLGSGPTMSTAMDLRGSETRDLCQVKW